jgi:N4-gp56 family major capsid protein
VAAGPSVTTQSLSQIVRVGYDRQAYYALRSQPLHESIADVKPAMQAMPGNVVTWTLIDNLAPASNALSEQSDVTPVALSTTQISVSLTEYGNAVIENAAIRATGFLDVDEATMNTISYNLVDTLDIIALNQLIAGLNVRYANGKASRTTLVANSSSNSYDLIQPADIRFVTAKMRGNKAAPKKQGFYVTFLHPDVSADFRAMTGSFAGWRDAHVYASPQALFAGEIGAFEGQVFVETPRASIQLNAGGTNPGTSNASSVYLTLTCGEQALARAAAIDPHVVGSPVVDTLRRFVGYGWYAMLGYGRFREAALYRTESVSTIGSN